MSDDAIAQAILNPTSSGDGFGPERREQGEQAEANDVETKETHSSEEGSGIDSQDEINDDQDDSYNPNSKYNRNAQNQGLGGRDDRRIGHTSASKRIQTSNARTGPKGVLRDRHESDQMNLKLERERIQALNRKNGQKLNFSALTLDQENRLRRKQEREIMRKRGEIDSDDEADDDDDDGLNSDEERVKKGAIANLSENHNDNGDPESKELMKLREKRLKELRESQIKTQALQQQRRRGLMSGAQSTGRWFGHLREVDEKGFVKAVEEDPGTSVVVHIYAKSVPACARLTSSLSSLARLHPRTKFLQVKASSIGFGSSSNSTSTSHKPTSFSTSKSPKGDEDDEEDEEDEVDEEDDEEYDVENQEDENSRDVLPTILIYRKGQLEANLVRPDLLEEEWRGGDERGVREILIKYGALSSTTAPHDDFSYAWNDVTRASEDE